MGRKGRREVGGQLLRDERGWEREEEGKWGKKKREEGEGEGRR